MIYTTLIDTDDLARNLGSHDWAVVDCRFSLDDPQRGRSDYLAAHIPGAVYADLEGDLSGRVVPGSTGRHPLPAVDRLAATIGAWGIGPGVQVVAYDDGNGSMAARLWWMLRWMGHSAVAVLDGGWARWRDEQRSVRPGVEVRPERVFAPHPRPELLAQVDDVLADLHAPDVRLIDVRSPERYRGEHEPIDAVAGHIPGAISIPFTDNLGVDGRFQAPEQLQQRFIQLLRDAPLHRAILYCGSGVTAAHTALALAHAGLGDARLYAGSWSEWIVDRARPVEQGDGSRG